MTLRYQLSVIRHTLRRMWEARKPLPLPSETDEGRTRLRRLEACGVEWRFAGNPVDHIGIALEVAKDYGIEIRPGLTYADCRAILPPDKWRKQPDIFYVPDGSWVVRGDVRAAICDCLISCHQVGIL